MSIGTDAPPALPPVTTQVAEYCSGAGSPFCPNAPTDSNPAASENTLTRMTCLLMLISFVHSSKPPQPPRPQATTKNIRSARNFVVGQSFGSAAGLPPGAGLSGHFGRFFKAAAERPLGSNRHVNTGRAGDLVARVRANCVFNGALSNPFPCPDKNTPDNFCAEPRV